MRKGLGVAWLVAALGTGAVAGGGEGKVIGRMQLDAVGFDTEGALDRAAGPFEGGVRARRARLGFQAWRGRWKFKFEWDQASGALETKDALVNYLVGGDIFTLGHHKEYFGLEQWTSTKYTTFIERAAPDIFTPARNFGLSLRHVSADRRITWGLGWHEERDGLGHQVADPGTAITGRVTYLPWRPREEKLLHLGLSLTAREPGAGGVRFRSRPEVSLGPRLVDTGRLAAEEERGLALEAAWVNGPLSLQSELFRHALEVPGAGEPTLTGWYLFASWFPTGEHRGYKERMAAFGAVHPRRRSGAVELALRVSGLDLASTGVAGGEMSGVSAGVNLYLDTQTRVQLNWNRTELAGVGDVTTISSRVAVFF